mmetsp:Transcript_2640/g.5929  ORF Transcript_2640/g.5929 Transcript_2640/m.5929 type:complete len:205 (-) Transcript_2640:258-872(-)
MLCSDSLVLTWLWGKGRAPPSSFFGTSHPKKAQRGSHPSFTLNTRSGCWFWFLAAATSMTCWLCLSYCSPSHPFGRSLHPCARAPSGRPKWVVPIKARILLSLWKRGIQPKKVGKVHRKSFSVTTIVSMRTFQLASNFSFESRTVRIILASGKRFRTSSKMSQVGFSSKTSYPFLSNTIRSRTSPGLHFPSARSAHSDAWSKSM